MNEKICPLLSLASPPINGPASCLEERCAWYMPPFTAKQEGRCAVQCLGVLPILTSEVGRL